ncbi:TlpA family protein disulfide reductase [Lutibacter holmesii]|uniref:TlpA family protein disulfide reductase n=1 Tax=Lutibacter holmesii TaxID=1137985 RepID=A0ABW3WJH1_9FLAO
MKYFISFFVTIFIFSCKPTEEKKATTYFGGEIVNPRTKFVLFLKDDKVIDTLLLDQENQFMAKMDNFTEGLYTFKHGLEFQYIYIEPADSILVRLNSWDFDESLVFSGKGARKNEFLINLFLQNEKEEKEMYSYFNLDETQFESKLKSLAQEREFIYQSFAQEELAISEGFENLTSIAIHYPLYRLKEVYPYYYKKAHKLNHLPTVSNEFYNFREHIDLNENKYLSFYPYQNYIVSRLYNLGNKLKETDSLKNDLTINVLNAISENIASETIKNTLLKRIVVNDFLKSETTCTINSEKLAIFLNNCTNEEYLNQVNNLVNDSKFVQNKEQLPNFEVVNYNQQKKRIKTIIRDKKTVIYFWSTQFMSSDYLVSRIQYLEQKYPKIEFIGIQMQPAYINVNTEPKLKNLNSKKQYKLTSTSYANNFLTSQYPRIIIINNNGEVMNGFTYLDSKKLDKELNKLQKN